MLDDVLKDQGIIDVPEKKCYKETCINHKYLALNLCLELGYVINPTMDKNRNPIILTVINQISHRIQKCKAISGLLLC